VSGARLSIASNSRGERALPNSFSPPVGVHSFCGRENNPDATVRKSKEGTEFIPATKGRTIIKRPGDTPAIGHTRKSPSYKGGPQASVEHIVPTL
jgi:hypothetical protein